MLRTSGPFTVVTREVSTGVHVAAGDFVSVDGAGVVNVGSYFNGGLIAPVIGPEGFPYWTPPPSWPAPNLTAYSLIWRIGSSSWFQSGTGLARVSSGGQIILYINDAFPNDNSRGWDVTIKVESPDPPPRALRITSMEAAQIIQSSGSNVELVANKRTMVRVFIDSGIRDDPTLSADPNLRPNVTGVLTLTQEGSRAPFATLRPVNPGGVVTARPMELIDRTDLTHSLNFILSAGATRRVNFGVRVFVQGHERDTSGGFIDSANREFTFRARPTQELLPILMGEPQLLGERPPTMMDYGESLNGAIARFPIADNGFTVLPPLSLPINDDLTTEAGWRLLLFNLSIMGLAFPSACIRTALVPNHSSYALTKGIGTARYVLNVPTFVARMGLPATFAHEMGHCFRIGHASCPRPGDENAPDGLDDRLPVKTEDVGVFMPPMMPAQLIPPGRGELMSYCDGQSRWPSISFINIMLEQDPIS